MENIVRVIGIDPGSVNTGWGIIEEKSGVLRLIDAGAIHSAGRGKEKDFSSRLAHIFYELCAILDRHKPTEAAVEQVFAAQNAATALKLGQARGVSIAALASYKLPIADYEPTLVKKSLVGAGRAEKSQVDFMVRQILGIPKDAHENWKMDTTDALGVAICHLNMRRFKALTMCK